MNTYFNIRYEFDKTEVHNAIAHQIASGRADYICVADGVILNTVNRNEAYKKVVNDGMFSICDSSYVPLYLRLIYGKRYKQYCGSDIFQDIISEKKYRMAFLGTNQCTLDALKQNLIKMNPAVKQMAFYELPFCKVEEFDYASIGAMLNNDGADIVWIALGAPKQEIFMSLLKPHLNRGVLIAVGAAFNFFSGINARRAPKWMLRHHLEFVYRIFCEPRKQIRRCAMILATLPSLLYHEWKKKRGKGNKTV